MAWMIALMIGAMRDTALMPGMAMPRNVALPLYAVVANLVLAVCFVLMAVWWLGFVDQYEFGMDILARHPGWAAPAIIDPMTDVFTLRTQYRDLVLA